MLYFAGHFAGFSKNKHYGLSLLEISIGLVILLVLGAIAFTRVAPLQADSERHAIKDLVPRLYSAAAVYTARYTRRPQKFQDFVSTTSSLVPNKTLSLVGAGTNGNCSITNGGQRINCPYKQWKNVRYWFNNGYFYLQNSPGVPSATSGNTQGW